MMFPPPNFTVGMVILESSHCSRLPLLAQNYYVQFHIILAQ